MTISDKGVSFICMFEGFSSVPYRDPGSVNGLPITIGFGTTHYPDGTKVTMHDAPITKEQALSYIGAYVNSKVSPWLTQHLPNLTQYQFDSLCSFCYNLGLGALEGSTLLKDIQAGASAAKETVDFDMWDRANHQVVAGLLKRRNAEATLFCTGSYGSI